MKNSDCAVLVLSCDKYSDLWKPFFGEFRKQWTDCPYKIYLGSNTKTYRGRGIRTILSGSGRDWSSDLFAILNKIDEEYIFVWIDDLFPVSKVNTDEFRHAFEFMKSEGANHIHMAPVIRPDGTSQDPMFGYYDKGQPYRINAYGFWRKNHLQVMLIPGENPWKFEIMGSYRSSYYDGYFTLTNPLFSFLRVVEKGKISFVANRYCRNHGISLNTRDRSVESGFGTLKSAMMHHTFHAMLHIPWRTRVRILETCRKVFLSY